MSASQAQLDALVQELHRRRVASADAQNATRWRDAREAMERLRVRVGREFSTAKVLRELREHSMEESEASPSPGAQSAPPND